MNIFILVLSYKKPLSEVEKYLSEHRIFLDKYYKNGNFIASGKQNPRIGGVILCKAKKGISIQSIIEEDPFYINNIARYDIIEFEVTMSLDNFKQMINN